MSQPTTTITTGSATNATPTTGDLVVTRPAGLVLPTLEERRTADIFRAVPDPLELRGDGVADDAGDVLFGHFAVFNRWTEIDSLWEGRFLERIAPGAAKKTMRENRDGMRVLFQHGHDPEVGDKPIAAIRDMGEDGDGAWYEAELFRGLPELVLDGLRAGQYGASFRFSVMREEWNAEPGTSEHNPEGLPERTIKEMRVREFGPVTFPAYAEATAGLRSITDKFKTHAPPPAVDVVDEPVGAADPVPTTPDPPRSTSRAPLYPMKKGGPPSWRL